MAVIDLGIGQALAALIFCQLHGLPLLSRAGIADGLQRYTVKGDRAHRLQRRRGDTVCSDVHQLNRHSPTDVMPSGMFIMTSLLQPANV